MSRTDQVSAMTLEAGGGVAACMRRRACAGWEHFYLRRKRERQPRGAPAACNLAPYTPL